MNGWQTAISVRILRFPSSNLACMSFSIRFSFGTGSTPSEVIRAGGGKRVVTNKKPLYDENEVVAAFSCKDRSKELNVRWQQEAYSKEGYGRQVVQDPALRRISKVQTHFANSKRQKLLPSEFARSKADLRNGLPTSRKYRVFCL